MCPRGLHLWIPAKHALKLCCCTMVTSNHLSQWATVSSGRKLMMKILDLLEYPKYNWKICSDLKVVSLLLGLQLGYTKHMCFLCLWNSRQDSSHYAIKAWPPRQNPQIGSHNVQHQPLQMSFYRLFISSLV